MIRYLQIINSKIIHFQLNDLNILINSTKPSKLILRNAKRGSKASRCLTPNYYFFLKKGI